MHILFVFYFDFLIRVCRWYRLLYAMGHLRFPKHSSSLWITDTVTTTKIIIVIIIIIESKISLNKKGDCDIKGKYKIQVVRTWRECKRIFSVEIYRNINRIVCNKVANKRMQQNCWLKWFIWWVAIRILNPRRDKKTSLMVAASQKEILQPLYPGSWYPGLCSMYKQHAVLFIISFLFFALFLHGNNKIYCVHKANERKSVTVQPKKNGKIRIKHKTMQTLMGGFFKCFFPQLMLIYDAIWMLFASSLLSSRSFAIFFSGWFTLESAFIGSLYVCYYVPLLSVPVSSMCDFNEMLMFATFIFFQSNNIEQIQ